MKKSLTFVLLLAAIFSNAQKFSTKLSEIGEAEIGCKRYPAEPDAEALILFDIGDSRFIWDENRTQFFVHFTRKTRIKIFKEEGIKYAEITLPYQDHKDLRERIVNIKACSYNFENGELIKITLDPKTIYEERVSDFSMHKKFAIPNVKVGSIIEYTYELITPHLGRLPSWKFQNRIPTLHSEYVARIIPFYAYQFRAQGFRQFDYNNSVQDTEEKKFYLVSYHDFIHTYIKKDVPSFKDESYITSVNDYIMKIDFQLEKIIRTDGVERKIISTWPAVVSDLLGNPDFGKYIKSCNKYAKKILSEELSISGLSKKEQIKEIINYVKSSYEWDGYQDYFAYKKTKDFMSQKTGNIGNINLFLVALFEAAQIEAEPVIISTRDHGKIIDSYPFIRSFNYVIVRVHDGENYFLTDASRPKLSYNRIPPTCINEKGLVIKKQKEGVEWIDLTKNPPSITSIAINVKIDSTENIAHVDLQSESTEILGFIERRHFNNDIEKLKDEMLDNGLSNISEIETSNFDDPQKEYIINLEGNIDLEHFGNQYIFQPFLKFPMQDNLLKQAKRTYPIDLIFPHKYNYHTKIEFPSAYSLTELPESYNKTTPLMDIYIEYNKVSPNCIEVKANYYIKKAVYHSRDYPKMRYYFNMIIKKFNEAIVLEKNI